MMRRVWMGVMAVTFGFVVPALGQDGSALESYFVGKMVVLKIDMPGTQKGVDLSYNKPAAMDWNEYSSRIKTFGIAIPKGTAARVTKFVVKNDMIEFHLDGGGFGTASDDSNTVVSPIIVPKSDREKDLEKKVAGATDPKYKRDLQSDLDRERARRDRINADNEAAAQVASQMKAQQVADRRLHGGSRFNLRWKGSIPSDDHSPDAITQLLAEYVDFDPRHAGSAVPPPVQGGTVQYAPAYGAPAPPPGAQGDGPAGSQLKRGMRIEDAARLLGPGRVASETISGDGLKTQVWEFQTRESVVEVTCVEGVVVRYSINSR